MAFEIPIPSSFCILVPDQAQKLHGLFATKKPHPASTLFHSVVTRLEWPTLTIPGKRCRRLATRCRFLAPVRSVGPGNRVTLRALTLIFFEPTINCAD